MARRDETTPPVQTKHLPTKPSSSIPPLAPIARGRRPDTTGRVPHGRYDGRPARLPPGGHLGSMPKSRNRSSAVAAVIDPMGDGDERILATVNGRVDVLEHDRSHGLISEAAYRTGCLLQGVIERFRMPGASNWAGASRNDPALVRDTRAQRLIDDGMRAAAIVARMRAAIGMRDSRILERILGDVLSFADCAALEGRRGERGAWYVAARYRDALEELAEVWTARGKAAPVAQDKHLDAATLCAARQQASIEDGVTMERLESELATLRGLKRPSAAEAREMEALAARIGVLRTLAHLT